MNEHIKHLDRMIIRGKHGKPIVADVSYTENGHPKPVVVFCHGYKGFKDWGAWHLVAESFAKAGFFFVKFNFSHNGGTVHQLMDFPDLESFGLNNYSIELDDLGSLMDHMSGEVTFQQEIDREGLILVGHSRGGGIATLKAAADSRVTQLVSWAGVSDFESRFPKGAQLKQWKESGVYHVLNSRTKQHMPHYYQFYEDFILHKTQLDIPNAAKRIKIPHLIIHGTNDTTVLPVEAQNLHRWSSGSELLMIEGGNHTFGSSHPWRTNTLPADLKKVVEASVSFIL